MAQTAPTKTSDFSGFLTPEMAAPIFEQAARTSVVQRLAPQTPLSYNGKDIPVVTGKASAGWVAEGATKPTTKGAISLKTISPKKLAAISVVSAEVVRANPGNYMSLLRNQIAEAFAIAFDNAALHNLGPDGTGTGPFATYIDQTTKATDFGTKPYDAFVAALQLLVTDKSGGLTRRLNGFALDSVVEPLVLSEKDGNQRPLWIDTPLDETTTAARPGRVIGRTAFMGDGIAAPTPGTASTAYPVAYAGDWTQTVWGVVGGISYDVSTEATVTLNGALTSLWENNLVAIRAEAEFGWLVNDAASFVKLTETTAA